MKITRCKKDRKYTIPTTTVAPNLDGWTMAHPPSDGFIIRLHSGKEAMVRGKFISDDEMIKAGFIPANCRSLAYEVYDAMMRKELFELAVSLGCNKGNKSKQQLIEWLLG